MRIGLAGGHVMSCRNMFRVNIAERDEGTLCNKE
jgi:hypothetical protein